MANYQNKTNLYNHVKELSIILEKNNTPNPNSIGNSWNVDKDFPQATFGGFIAGDYNAFMFLKKNGHIASNICWDSATTDF